MNETFSNGVVIDSLPLKLVEGNQRCGGDPAQKSPHRSRTHPDQLANRLALEIYWFPLCRVPDKEWKHGVQDHTADRFMRPTVASR